MSEPAAKARLIALAITVGCGGPQVPPPPPPLAHTAYAHYLEGKLAAFRDDWPGAAEALAAAAAAAPDQPMVAVELARAQHKAKRDDAARATLAAARKQWPEHEQVWLASGDQLATAAPAEAMQAYRRAIELDPLDERAYVGLAKLEKPPEAMATLRRLVDRVPTSIEGHFRLGQRLALANDRDAAVRELRAVLELDPDHIDARLDLSRVLRMQGKIADAVVQTRSAFDRAGQSLDIAEELFWLLCEADDRQGAIDLLTLLDDDRSDLEALAAVARLYRGLGRLDASRAIAVRIGKLDSQRGAIALAETELAGGDAAAAAKRALAVPETSEVFVEARRIAAAAFAAIDQPQRALDAIAPARAAKPEDLELAVTAAFALVDVGKPADARALLAALGTSQAIRFARARLEDHAADTASALGLAEKLIAEKPDLPSALNLAGYLLADSNQRLADAARYLGRARELSPGDPAILDSWGWLLYRRGQTREAVRALDHAARFAPREAEILVHLAIAWAADGAPRTAAEVLDRAAALKPSPAVLKRIETVRSGLPPRR